jgi:hypothetical protein
LRVKSDVCDGRTDGTAVTIIGASWADYFETREELFASADYVVSVTFVRIVSETRRLEAEARWGPSIPATRITHSVSTGFSKKPEADEITHTTTRTVRDSGNNR